VVARGCLLRRRHSPIIPETRPGSASANRRAAPILLA
jgi:hypothetical protein